MGIITKEVSIQPTGKLIQYYKDLGYDAKWREPLTVQIEDLPKNSHAAVDVLCDMCKKNILTVWYENYNKTVNKTGSYVCKECSPKKVKETNIKRYGVENVSNVKEVKDKRKQSFIKKIGVENPTLLPEIREKIKQTNIKRYGVENVFYRGAIRDKRDATLIERYGTTYPLQNEECFKKFKQTNLEKYGVEYIPQIKEVKEKVKQTNLSRFGVEYASQNEEVKEKIRQTNLEKYGTEYLLSLPEFHKHSREVDVERYGVYHHLQNPEILAKQKETFYKNGTCIVSKQQEYLFNLYKTIDDSITLNFPVSYYNADIYFPNEKIILEYDGAGHDLNVRLGSMTQEEFNAKEIIRFYIIKREGYKQIHIVSKADKLPQDQILLDMLSYARNYFSTTSHSWIEFNIDFQTIRNAENKEGISYNYGELRAIPSTIQN